MIIPLKFFHAGLSRWFSIGDWDHNKAVNWMVSSHPLFSMSLSPITNTLVTAPTLPITIGITEIVIVFSFSTNVLVLIFLFTFLQFYSVISWNGKVHYSAGTLFLLNTTRSGHLADFTWFICISKFQRISCLIHQHRFLIVHIQLVRMVNMILHFHNFFTPSLTYGYHWRLSDSKSPQVFRTLLRYGWSY